MGGYGGAGWAGPGGGVGPGQGPGGVGLRGGLAGPGEGLAQMGQGRFPPSFLLPFFSFIIFLFLLSVLV